ncbi:MAG TPA: hypothetical protein VG944_00375 [Fimbriimonas sp.]|nr:hypothetical protein [Fimbriimonas sp.]
MPEDRALPRHGRIECRRCWDKRDGQSSFTSKNKRFQLINDPGAWGAQDPKYLVLGITKGNTQSDAMSISERDGSFDQVAFKDFRPRLTRVLHAVGLATHTKSVSELISANERNFGWGSVVRCSLTGWDKKNGVFSGESGKVLPAFKDLEMGPVVSNCFDQFLSVLPPRVKIVVLLGNSDDYVEKMSYLVRTRYLTDFSAPPSYERIAYHAGGRLWVHVGHPSRGNGYLMAFLEGDPDVGQGRKREIAKQAIRNALDATS